MFGEWAGKRLEEFEEEFNVERQRGLKITDLVRKILSDPAYDDLRKNYDENEFSEVFVKQLTSSLKNQRGNSIEERWNNLVRSYSLHKQTNEDVFLDSGDSSVKDLSNTSLEDWNS